MSQQGAGGASMTPLSDNPIQLQNILAGTGSPPPATQAGLPVSLGVSPIRTGVSPIELQQITRSPTMLGTLNSALPGTPTPNAAFPSQGGTTAQQNALGAMRAAQEGRVFAPAVGDGRGGGNPGLQKINQFAQQLDPVLNLLKWTGLG